jgi:hypothetical protein
VAPGILATVCDGRWAFLEATGAQILMAANTVHRLPLPDDAVAADKPQSRGQTFSSPNGIIMR